MSFPVIALFCIDYNTFECLDCRIMKDEPYGFSFYEDEPYDFSFYEDVTCNCRYIRISFVPRGTEYFLDRIPKTSKYETIYEVHIEREMAYDERTQEIESTSTFGFDTSDDNTEGIIELLSIVKNQKIEIVSNPKVKRSREYADYAIQKLNELLIPEEEESKKTNPHLGKRKKKM